VSGTPPQEATQTLPQSALANYLDTLLAEIDEEKDLKPAQTVKEALPQADTKVETTASAEASVSVAEQPTVAADSIAKSNVPAWAETPFQVLRFRVNDVNLLVPLSCLTGIIPLDGSISRLPGQPAWSLGVVMNRDSKVVVVDTRRLLMQTEVENKVPHYSHLLLIGDGDRGLAVEALGDTATIDKEAVRWRGEAMRHPWYGGILVQELSVLLDVDGVIEMLAA
jgi:chemotaxis signal transduction protein